MSFISRKTFPSDPYIPYHIREIDLSHNNIPILTKELSFGTRKVKFLNISHNHINEIRHSTYNLINTHFYSNKLTLFTYLFTFFTIVDVLLNLTDLERLDISHNKISTFIHETNISFPRNLTHLYARNNSIYDFSSVLFSNLTAIKSIDVRDNVIESIELDFSNRIKTGLELFISGEYAIEKFGS